MDKMREEFDSWIAVYMPDYELEYSGWIEAMFGAWQASRQALVVELPDAWDSNAEIGSYSNAVHSALDSAGIKWTE